MFNTTSLKDFNQYHIGEIFRFKLSLTVFRWQHRFHLRSIHRKKSLLHRVYIFVKNFIIGTSEKSTLAYVKINLAKPNF